MCVEFYVLGVGYCLIEVFIKIIGEYLKIGEWFLGLICFLMFVVMDCNIELLLLVVDKLEYMFVV